MLAWDAESGEPLTPVVTWQDKRSQEVLDRLESDGQAERSRELSGMPLDPYFSAGKLTWLLDTTTRSSGRASRAAFASAPSTRSSATGSGRASPPTPRRPLAPSSGRPTGTTSCSRSTECRARRCPRSATPPATSEPCATRAGRSSCRFAPAASTSRPRSPGPAAPCPEGSRRPTGPGLRPRPRRCRAAAPRGWPAAHRRLAHRRPRSSGRSTAASSPPARCSSGSAATSGSPPTRLRSSAAATEVDDSKGVRILPALAGLGAPWWRSDARAVIAGLDASVRARPHRPRGARGDRLASC